jgi:hypothetical protein
MIPDERRYRKRAWAVNFEPTLLTLCELQDSAENSLNVGAAVLSGDLAAPYATIAARRAVPLFFMGRGAAPETQKPPSGIPSWEGWRFSAGVGLVRTPAAK